MGEGVPGGAANGLAAGVGAGQRPILHVVFVVDGSGSMSGERIASLNWAARAAVPAMREAAVEHPGIDVLIRVLRFSDTADWPIAEPTPVAGFVWTNLAAGGESQMGAALHALASAFAAEAAEAEQRLPPVVILLSDGFPTDDADEGLAALVATALGAKAVRIAIAIGQDADLDVLQRFIGDETRSPLQANSAEMLVSHVRWATSVPVRAASGAEPWKAAAQSEDPAADPPGGLVW